MSEVTTKVMAASARIVAVNSLAPDPQTVELAAVVLRAGDVIVAPTDTRYGLLASAESSTALGKVFEIKRRRRDHALAVFVATVEDMWTIGTATSAARSLARELLPGALTLTLAPTAGALNRLPSSLFSEGRIGVRVSDCPLISELIRACGTPLTATSANLAGQPQAASVEGVAAELNSGVSLFLDAGELDGAPSTVVDCSEELPRLIRRGAISEREIERSCRI
ncbi:MAG: L-threonylcarbamoyladenylate synthase [Candidatus Zixiibacteriota bacterium]